MFIKEQNLIYFILVMFFNNHLHIDVNRNTVCVKSNTFYIIFVTLETQCDRRRTRRLAAAGRRRVHISDIKHLKLIKKSNLINCQINLMRNTKKF